MFKVVNNKGFQMEFPNGWTASVMFGSTNYCTNRWTFIPSPDQPNQSGGIESTTAEISAWNSETGAEFFDDNDNVEGWVTAEDVVAFLSKVAAQI